jgi:hypothetical protein
MASTSEKLEPKVVGTRPNRLAGRLTAVADAAASFGRSSHSQQAVIACENSPSHEPAVDKASAHRL